MVLTARKQYTHVRGNLLGIHIGARYGCVGGNYNTKEFLFPHSTTIFPSVLSD